MDPHSFFADADPDPLNVADSDLHFGTLQVSDLTFTGSSTPVLQFVCQNLKTNLKYVHYALKIMIV